MKIKKSNILYILALVSLSLLIYQRYEVSKKEVENDNRLFSQIEQEALQADYANLGLCKKVYFWNFLASWCKPCYIELPIIASIKARYNNVNFIGVAYRDEVNNVSLMSKNPVFDKIVKYESLFIHKNLGLSKIPITFISDEDGNIIYKVTGVITKKDIKEIEKILASQQNNKEDNKVDC